VILHAGNSPHIYIKYIYIYAHEPEILNKHICYASAWIYNTWHLYCIGSTNSWWDSIFWMWTYRRNIQRNLWFLVQPLAANTDDVLSLLNIERATRRPSVQRMTDSSVGAASCGLTAPCGPSGGGAAEARPRCLL